jgi:phosphoribosylaminoimidazole (AIR) synthetase
VISFNSFIKHLVVFVLYFQSALLPRVPAGESLLTPTKIYVRGVLGSLRSGMVKAAAHITGGGLPGNIPRVLPDGVGVHLDALTWNVPPVFGWLSSSVCNTGISVL